MSPFFATPNDQQQVSDLFNQALQYQKLTETQQQQQCLELKQDYQSQANWQTAWLIVNALNNNYHCLESEQTVKFLQSIEKAQYVPDQILWLNNKHIQFQKIYQKHENQQTELLSSQKKNIRLLKELNDTKKQLRQVNSKIQALKTIETNINKKLEEQSVDGQ